ncbi:MAG: hypothetical protein NTZ35_08575 [Ignavibacteriales bacterium]|nr:hypothetical protein [Ignavibacteriales bacterium]
MNRYTRFVIACALLMWSVGTVRAQVRTSSAESSRSISRILGISPDSSGKCGTSDLIYARLHWNELSVQKRTAIQKILSRPAKQKDRLSRSGRFRIHYDTTGIDAPSLITSGPNSQKIPNSVEQYIDSVGACFDFAWKLEVDTLGYLAPPSDGMQGGGPEYDVYVSQRGLGDFGLTNWDESVDLITDGTRQTFSSFIEIDNAFFGYRTPGLDGLRITAAHEFHHACQIGNYGIWKDTIVPNSDFYFYELSAVYMERLAYSGIHDYYFDLPAYFQRFRDSQSRALSFSTYTQQYPGYERSIWAQYLSKRFGRDIMRQVWTGVISDPVLVSTGKVLQRYGTSLESEFAQFSFWNYYTADRAQAGKYYDDAANWPRFVPNVASTFGGLSASVSNSGWPLSTQFCEFAITGDTVTAILVDVNATSAVVSNPPSTPYQLLLTSANATAPYQTVGRGLTLSFFPDDQSQWKTLYLKSSTKSIASVAGDPFPNPVRISHDSKLNLPLSGSTEKRAVVYFLNAALELVMSREYDVTESFGSRLLSVPASDLRDGIPTGVYFVKARCGDKEFQWKVAIIQ